MGGDTNVLWFPHGEEGTVKVEQKLWGLPAPHNLRLTWLSQGVFEAVQGQGNK